MCVYNKINTYNSDWVSVCDIIPIETELPAIFLWTYWSEYNVQWLRMMDKFETLYSYSYYNTCHTSSWFVTDNFVSSMSGGHGSQVIYMMYILYCRVQWVGDTIHKSYTWCIFYIVEFNEWRTTFTRGVHDVYSICMYTGCIFYSVEFNEWRTRFTSHMYIYIHDVYSILSSSMNGGQRSQVICIHHVYSILSSSMSGVHTLCIHDVYYILSSSMSGRQRSQVM